MSDQPRIRVPVDFPGAVSAEQLATRLEELDAAGLQAAIALSKGEISSKDYAAGLRTAAAETRALEQAQRVIDEANRSSAQALAALSLEQERSVAAIEAIAQADRDAAQAAEMFLRAQRQAATSPTATAVQHPNVSAVDFNQEVTAHLEQVAAAARDEAQAVQAATAEVYGLGDAEERAAAGARTEADASQRVAEAARLAAGDVYQLASAEEIAEAAARRTASALQAETAATYGVVGATHAETAAFAQTAAVHNLVESEAEQLTGALHLEENAIYEAGRAAGYFTIEVSAAASAEGKLDAAVKTTRSRLSNTQQSITSASYAFQDFTATSGDLGAKLNSVSNNLPTLLIGLGGLGVGISVASTAAIAFYRNWDSVTGFFDEKSPFPKAEHDIAGMKRELDAGKESLEKMEKAGSGTAAQLEKYNELRERTAYLETEIADQQERQGRVKKLLEAPTEEAEGRGKGFDESTKGKYQETQDKIEAALDQGMQAELEAAWASRTASVQSVKAKNLSAQEELRQIDSVNAAYRQQKSDIEARIKDSGKTAGELMDRLHKGDAEAFHSLDLLIAGTGHLFGDLRQQMAEANPHIKKLVDEAEKEIEEWWKYQEDAVKAAEKELDGFVKVVEHSAAAQTEAEEEISAFVEHSTAERRKAAMQEMKALEEDAKEGKERGEAEAKWIKAFAGKDAKEQFGATVAAQAAMTGGDPEQIARQLAAQQAAQWARPKSQDGLGATQEGARLAAQQLAAGAGFRVTLPQIGDVQRNPVVQRKNKARQRSAEDEIDALRKDASRDTRLEGIDAKMRAHAGAAAAQQRGAESEIDAYVMEQTARPRPAADAGVRQLGQAQGNNQQKLMQVASQQNGAIGALLTRQQAQAQGIDRLLREASELRGQATNAPSASNSGRFP